MNEATDNLKPDLSTVTTVELMDELSSRCESLVAAYILKAQSGQITSNIAGPRSVHPGLILELELRTRRTAIREIDAACRRAGDATEGGHG